MFSIVRNPSILVTPVPSMLWRMSTLSRWRTTWWRGSRTQSRSPWELTPSTSWRRSPLRNNCTKNQEICDMYYINP